MREGCAADAEESRLPGWVPSTDRPRSLRWLRWGIVVVLVLGGLFFLLVGADGPADPFLVPDGGAAEAPDRDPAAAEAEAGALRERFGTVAATITRAGGEVLERCLLLADDDDRRQRGLMEITQPELGGFDGMVFEFPAPIEAGFSMRNTPMPLSIAFLDADGRFVSATDMVPCPDVDGCPGYGADGPFRLAVEVPRGGLDELGLNEGSQLSLGAPCAPTG